MYKTVSATQSGFCNNKKSLWKTDSHSLITSDVVVIRFYCAISLSMDPSLGFVSVFHIYTGQLLYVLL